MTNPCPEFSHLLVLPKLRIQNANAISSPLTHGFPSMTAFLGLMWALQRRTRAAGLDLDFRAVGVVCHDHDEQVTDGFVKAFRLTRNPVDKDGGTAAIVEEGRIHLTVSVVLAVHSEQWRRDPDRHADDARAVADIVAGMRVAGGSVLTRNTSSVRSHPYVVGLGGNEEDRASVFRKLRSRLLPGFALVEREDLIDARLDELRQSEPDTSRLDAWLSLSQIHWHYDPPTGETEKGAWSHDRHGLGWIVPIPVGYGALAPLQSPGSVPNARDATTPFRFVESLYSFGEWISPHRLQSPQQLLWYADSQAQEGRYRCRNDFRPATDSVDLLQDFE